MALGSLFSNLFRSSRKAPEATPVGAGSALDERMTHRREAVEQAVTEAMMDVGLVSSGYRHEARAVDSRGHRFVVSIDLPKELASTTAGILAQIGATISRKARIMNGAEVVVVYWRTEHDEQAQVQEPLNLLAASPSRAAPPAPVVPEAPPVPAAQSDTEIAAQRIAKLRELMKDEEEPDHGFANTVMGLDFGDTPPKKR